MGTAFAKTGGAFPRHGLAAGLLAAVTALAGCGDGFHLPEADVGPPSIQSSVAEPAAPQASIVQSSAVSQTSSYGYIPYVPNPATLGDSTGLPQEEASCRIALNRLGVIYRELPPVDDGGVCRIDHPVGVSGFSGGIKLQPEAKLNCTMALTLARWVKKDLAPAVRLRYLTGVASIRQLSSYSCRTMNNVRGAKMSEHSKGNAIDIGSITLKNGRTLDVTKPGFFAFRQRALLNTVRGEACGYFTTVLGPGDAYHGNHFHFDLMQRRGRRICE